MSISIILLFLIIIFLFFGLYILIRKVNNLQNSSFLTDIDRELKKFEPFLKDEFSRNREESQKAGREMREELNNSLRFQSETLTKIISELTNSQRNQFDSFSNQISALAKNNEERIEKVREAVEIRLKTLQEENSKKLEEMRVIVDEKLQSTLEKRLTESFNQVSDRLKQVHEGLGEMKTLATGVGDLKKVLSNVKTRGILGEIQLGSILENILSPEQYEANVITRDGSQQNVEFAIKLPGRDSEGPVYLPIDSKFPIGSYQQLLDAYEASDKEKISKAQKELEGVIKNSAKDINIKYINPPKTTDFGILFLPFEGLYAEVVKQPNLIETLQKEYKIIISGPTTLAAFLNSLYMGFRTLAIQKRTSEVWNILASVKKEFDTFGDVLEKAQNKIRQAGEDIDLLVGRRTRQIQSKLKDVETLPDTPPENLS